MPEVARVARDDAKIVSERRRCDSCIGEPWIVTRSPCSVQGFSVNVSDMPVEGDNAIGV